MAEEEVAVEEEQGEKKGKGKLFIIIGVVVALGGGYFMFGSGGGSEEAGVTTTTEVVEGVVIEGDQMTVVLADSDTRYARITFGVVLPVAGDSAAVGAKMPLLKDAALSIVSELTADDLKGAAGLDRLRTALTASALEIFTEGEVIRIVLTEVLVQ